jgi:hypothetical protein
MNIKQGIATGVLAVVIVTSVALMPVSAEVKEVKAKPAPVRSVGLIAQTPARPSQPVPPNDLTYN